MRRFFLLAALSCAVGVFACGSQQASVCDNDALVFGCVVGHCRLSAGSSPLPPNTQIDLAEVPVDPALQGDPISSSLCSVVVPSGTAIEDITLSMASDQPPPDAIIFEWANQLSSALPSAVHSSSVSVFLPGSGTFGLTHDPSAVAVGGTVGTSPPASDTVPNILRNLQLSEFTAAFYDGTHLLIGNGSRLLVYNGIPKITDLPAIVLGVPDFNSLSTGITSASSFGGSSVDGIWSDGTRLTVSNGSRVLVWLTFPKSSYAPADIVLGQADFASNKPNRSGDAGPDTLFKASTIDSDGTRLLVADTWNHRLLQWSTFPTSIGQPADTVVGQPSFSGNSPYSGATPLYLPYGAALHSAGAYVSGLGGPGLRLVDTVAQNNPPASTLVFCWPFGDTNSACGEAAGPAGLRTTPLGGVALRDWELNRVLVTTTAPSGPTLPSFVVGQPDPKRMVTVTGSDAFGVNAARVFGSTFGNGYTIGGAGDNLVIADDLRVLIWSHFPTYDFEPADHVFGQAGFSVNEVTDYRNVTESSLADPNDVSIRSGIGAVADTNNSRVLLFHESSMLQPIPQAFAALGQTSMSAFVANHDLATIDASGLSGPRGVCLDGTHLVVADTENHRVLIWKSVPTQTGTPADIVLGQHDFAQRSPNAGRKDVAPLDGFSDVDADGLFFPIGVACDGTHLVVADRANHRVLVWKQFPTANGQPADAVIGQPSLTSAGAHGGQGPFVVTADGFNLPSAIALDGTSLWVADTENNRVVRWDDVFGTPTPSAWLGQSSSTTVSNPNYQFAAGPFQGSFTPTSSTSMTSVLRPRGIAVVAGTLYVSETDSNRVHAFDTQSLASVAVIGQPDADTAAANSVGVSATSLSEPGGLSSDGTNLWAVDSRNSRVLGYSLANLSSGAAASHVIGQATTSQSGFNAATTAAGGTLRQPAGLCMTAKDELFAADPQNHRVLAFDTSVIPPTLAMVIGQTNSDGDQPNAGNGISASGLDSPRGVWADSARIIVADTDNNRVLVFDRATSTSTAAVVLGQNSTDAGTSNPGGITSSTMASPLDVCSDGTRIAVVDSGNSRVLVWTTEPTQNGQAAGVILGQVTSNFGSPNLGTGVAAINTLALPTACLFAPEGLYVADTGNNRVVLYADVSTGANAVEVLGQPNATSRVPASTLGDTTHFAGPAGLAFDGVNLYIADRDLGRIVVLRDAKDGGTLRYAINEGAVGYHPTSGIAAKRTPFFTSSLYVSDATSNRIFQLVSLSRLGIP